MTEELPRLGEDFNILPLQIREWVGWLIYLPKIRPNKPVRWIPVAWRVSVEDAIAEAQIQLARRNQAA